MGDDVSDQHASIFGQPLEARSLARVSGDLAAAGGVRLVELADGIERGIRVVEFRTGTGLAFEVLVDRAMDIGPAEYRGCSFGWRSPTGFRHPGLHENADESGLSWLRSFSGLLVTAGLDHTLFPGEFDAAQYRYAPRARVEHSLHGRVANIPARLIGYGRTWHREGCTLYAEGEVRQAAVFGEDLVLRRRVEAELGSSAIRIQDVVTNQGFVRTPHMFLYHVNVGWPLLDDGTEVRGSFGEILWQSESVAQQGAPSDRIWKPQSDFTEQVWEHRLVPDRSGYAFTEVVNPRLGVGLRMSWNVSEFPCYFQWLNLREGNYALGLEPSTHHVGGEAAARLDGSFLLLEPGESRTYQTLIELRTSAP
jgi:hypothetical protein